MVDSITEEDLNRWEGEIDLEEVNTKEDYNAKFRHEFGKAINTEVRDYLWDKQAWQKATEKLKGKRRSWEEGEADFILKHIEQRPVWIAKHFPTARTYFSVYGKMRRLKEKYAKKS